jgi:hypothetical protein
LHPFLLWLWHELLCRVGLLSNLLRGIRDLGAATIFKSNLVAVFLLWSIGMALAQLDVLENTGDAAMK